MEQGRDENIRDYFSRMDKLINEMKSNGDDIKEKEVVEKIMRTLSPRFDYVVAAIEEAKDLTTMTLNDLQASLESREMQMNERSSGTFEQALKAHTTVRNDGFFQRRPNQFQRGQNFKGRGRNPQSDLNQGTRSYSFSQNKSNIQCHKCQKYEHFQSECKSHIQCQNCKKYGHYSRECRTKALNTRDSHARVAETEDEMKMVLTTCHAVAADQNENQWLLDTGCSNHLSGNKELFSDLDENFHATVKLGDDSKLEVLGKGKIAIRLKDGSLNYISDVFYAPGICQNLLSVGQLAEKGYDLKFNKEGCTINDVEMGLIVKTNMSRNRLFPMNIKYDADLCCKATVVDDNWLWHMRLGHFNFESIKFLANKKWVTGLPVIKAPDQLCEACVVGKKHRDPFPKGRAWRASKPLELVHSDLCYVEVPSNGGNKYFITFIDDFSRKTWVYILKNKSDACDTLKKFMVYVERRSGYTLKTLRTDRGTEYIVCDDFLKKQGVKHQMTARYTPQQNGVAERKNRTVMDIVRSMLHCKKLPKSYWAEAVACAVYLLNRCPVKSVRDKTPEEAWSGQKPNLSHLKVFSCVAYAHVPDQLRKKLDDKAEKCIFVGYSEETKAYKLYNPETQKVIISRDVTFDEDGMWDWSEMQKEPLPVPVIINEEVDDKADEPPVEATTDIPTQRYPQRERRPPTHSQDYEVGRDDDPDDREEEVTYYALFADYDPVTYEEAANEDCWMKAMDEEIHAIEKNDTWELTTLPEGKKPIGVKWVYKTKYNPNGEVDRFKARLVAKGYKQKPGIDYFEVFAPVARMDTVRMILSLASQNQWKIFQMDVKSAFLNGVLEEEVYIEQPPGYLQQGEEDKVYKLKKALYGLKQAPRAWYTRIDTYFINNGFHRSPYEHALYVKANNSGDIIIVCLYVDDLIFTSNNPKLLAEFKESMSTQFEMTDMGLMSYFLGIEVKQTDEGILISQKKYAVDVLKKLKMESCKPMLTPVEERLKLERESGGDLVNSTNFRRLVGSLRYLTATRPDIVYGVGLISRFMDLPRQSHWQAAKRILRYIKGTINEGIFYSSTNKLELIGYTDSDWAGETETRKSTSGYAFHLGAGVFSWSSKKQQVVALSTAEAEYIAATNCATQAVWLRRMLSEL